MTAFLTFFLIDDLKLEVNIITHTTSCRVFLFEPALSGGLHPSLSTSTPKKLQASTHHIHRFHRQYMH